MITNLYSRLEIPLQDKTTSVRKEEGEFLYNFIKEKKIKRTLEIGMAYGCSTAYIMSATRSHHYVIDPFQELFKNIGIKNIESLGLESFLIFKKDYSHFVLPNLIKEGVKIDFAFVDGDHRFDALFCDFYFIDLMLNIGGYIVLHDTWMRSIQYVIAWVHSNKKNYNIIKIPQANMILLQKKEELERPWHHFKGFFTLKSIISHWYLTRRLPYGDVKTLPKLFRGW
jgi:predicted O-methyltransferase YrrM